MELLTNASAQRSIHTYAVSEELCSDSRSMCLRILLYVRMYTHCADSKSSGAHNYDTS